MPECSFCKNIESRGIKSPRLQVADNPVAILGVHPNSGLTDITSLELQIDTECNSACLICGEHNSSTWQKYNVSKITGKQIFNKSIDLNIKLRTESRFKKLKENVQLDKITLLVFLGGEPLGNDLHKEMILEVKKVKSLNDVMNKSDVLIFIASQSENYEKKGETIENNLKNLSKNETASAGGEQNPQTPPSQPGS